MRSSEPRMRIAAVSMGHPVIALHDSGDRKYHTPKMNDTMNPRRKIYFAKLGTTLLILIHTP
jgi:hypothetical protein